MKLRHKQLLQKTFAEFIGTFFFIFISIGTVMSTDVNNPFEGDFESLYADRQLTIALAFGFSILVLGYSFGHVSGAHFNPAVTIALTVFRRCEIVQALAYIPAQMLGALTAGGLLKAAIPDIWNTSFGNNELHPTVEVFQGVILEIIGTAALTLVVFSTAVDPRFDNPRGRASFVAIIPISITVVLAHVLLIPLTGCGINPARSFASAVMANSFKDHWIFWVGPIVGGLLGACISWITNLTFDPHQGDDYSRAASIRVAPSTLEPLLTSTN